VCVPLVSTAVTVADALEKINAAEPDVLLCDYELDGEVATRLLRIVGREHPRVRRVLYSGVVTERLNACLSEGLAEQTLEKPAELEEILAAISGSA